MLMLALSVLIVVENCNIFIDLASTQCDFYVKSQNNEMKTLVKLYK